MATESTPNKITTQVSVVSKTINTTEYNQILKSKKNKNDERIKFCILAIYHSGPDIHEIKRSKLIDGFTLCPNWELSIDLKLLPPVDNQSIWRNILRIRKPGPQSSNSLDEKIAIGERLTPFLEFKRISFVHLHSQFLFIYVLLQRKML